MSAWSPSKLVWCCCHFKAWIKVFKVRVQTINHLSIGQCPSNARRRQASAVSLIFFWQALSREEPASVAAPATLETKVRNDSLPVGLIPQDILKLDVPVDDALAVQVTQPRKDLSEEKPGDLLMSHRLPPDDGRLPLQVLGDLGLLDLVKCHHLQSHLLVQNDGVCQYLSSSFLPTLFSFSSASFDISRLFLLASSSTSFISPRSGLSSTFLAAKGTGCTLTLASLAALPGVDMRKSGGLG